MRSAIPTRMLGPALAAAVGVVLGAHPALAWEPEEEVQLVIHTGTKGSTNFFVRDIAEHLDKMLPHGAEPVNMPGAGGDRARRYVLEREGNPHVLGSLTPSNVNNPILVGAEYSAKSFTPVAVIMVDPLLVAVNAKSPYKSLEDLIKAARKDPGAIVQGGGDVGEVDSLYNAMLSQAAGIEMAFTPFENKGIVALLGGHVDLVMANPAQIYPYVKSGDFRILAANLKLPSYPDVPTFDELGYDVPLLKQYRGFWMPGGVPTEARDYYIAQLEKVSRSEEFKDYVKKNNLIPEFVAGADLAAMLQEEEKVYRKLDKELGLLE